MSLSPDIVDAIRDEVRSQFVGLGSLFVVGQPQAPSLASPTGFGLVETQFSEGAPVALNAAGLYRAILPADVANNQSTLGNAQSMGAPMMIPVGIGQSWIVRWLLFIGTAAGTAGGIDFTPQTPAFTDAKASLFGPSTGLTVFSSSIVVPNGALSQTVVRYDGSTFDSPVIIEATFRNFTVAGNIDLRFGPSTNLENYIVRKDSSVVAYRVA